MQQNQKGSKFLLYMLPAIVWAIGIFVIISLPGSAIPKSRLLNIEHIDKAIHFILFFVFCFLLCFGFFKQQTFKTINKNYFSFAISISIFYGGITEVLQAILFTSRHGNIWDFLANSAGALTGALIFGIIAKNLLLNKSNVNQYY